jgi:hypothetical protein
VLDGRPRPHAERAVLQKSLEYPTEEHGPPLPGLTKSLPEDGLRPGCVTGNGLVCYGARFRPPFGLGCTSAGFTCGFFANGVYSGSPTSTVIQLQNSIDRA